MDFVELGYIGMFLSAFLAATVLPLGSEIVFSALLYNGSSPLWLTLIAGIGNTLGGLTSYYLGRLGKWDWLSKWFKIEAVHVYKYMHYIQKIGAPIALITWLPAIGDMLAVALGFAHTKVIKTSLYMLVGKLARFATIAYIWQTLGS